MDYLDKTEDHGTKEPKREKYHEARNHAAQIVCLFVFPTILSDLIQSVLQSEAALQSRTCRRLSIVRLLLLRLLLLINPLPFSLLQLFLHTDFPPAASIREESHDACDIQREESDTDDREGKSQYLESGGVRRHITKANGQRCNNLKVQCVDVGRLFGFAEYQSHQSYVGKEHEGLQHEFFLHMMQARCFCKINFTECRIYPLSLANEGKSG